MIQGDGWALAENPKCATTAMRLALSDCLAFPEKHASFMSQTSAPGKPLRAVCVRNPYDRLVSGWAYNSHMRVPFLEWLCSPETWDCGVGLDFKRVPQTAWAWRCSVVMRFENLADDWPAFCEKAGLGERPLPRENPSEHPPYRDVICAQARAVVEDRFAPDFRWGYRW